MIYRPFTPRKAFTRRPHWSADIVNRYAEDNESLMIRTLAYEPTMEVCLVSSGVRR